jgi:hypothetical protein
MKAITNITFTEEEIIELLLFLDLAQTAIEQKKETGLNIELYSTMLDKAQLLKKKIFDYENR